jgi:prepilin-type N-terminal cleavage/methylation domain-containing protein
LDNKNKSVKTTNEGGEFKMKINTKGFTLIEMLIVIGIIAALTAIFTPSISSHIAKTEAAKNLSNQKIITAAVFQHENQNNNLPTGVAINEPTAVSALVKADIQKILSRLGSVNTDVDYDAIKTDMYTIDKSKISKYVKVDDSISDYFIVDESSPKFAGYIFSLKFLYAEDVTKKTLQFIEPPILPNSSILNYSNVKGFSGISFAHSIALKNDGTLWGWGRNDSGQLGLGNYVDTNIPTPIGTANDWLAVCTGYAYTVALKKDKSLWAWGANDYGQLGGSLNAKEASPLRIGTENTWEKISCGMEYTVAIKSNGTLWSWGRNDHGQLGVGDNGNKTTPTPAGTDTNWASVAAGSYHIMALKTDKTLWASGWNNYGQLGLGDFNPRNILTPVGTDHWNSIHAGSYHNLGIKEDSTLWSWGQNTYGQLGDNTFADKNSPMPVGTSTDWLFVSAGGWHSLAIKRDFTLWSWGYNSRGQLGDPAIAIGAKRNTPLQVGLETNWRSVDAGLYHSMMLKTDSTLWGTGYNRYGGLGNGNNVDQAIPITIGTEHYSANEH